MDEDVDKWVDAARSRVDRVRDGRKKRDREGHVFEEEPGASRSSPRRRLGPCAARQADDGTHPQTSLNARSRGASSSSVAQPLSRATSRRRPSPSTTAAIRPAAVTATSSTRASSSGAGAPSGSPQRTTMPSPRSSRSCRGTRSSQPSSCRTTVVSESAGRARRRRQRAGQVRAREMSTRWHRAREGVRVLHERRAERGASVRGGSHSRPARGLGRNLV